MTKLQKMLASRLQYGRKRAGIDSQAEMSKRLAEIGVEMSTDQIKGTESGRRDARQIEVLGYAVLCEQDPAWFYDDLPDNLAAALQDDPGWLTRMMVRGSAAFDPRTDTHAAIAVA